MDNRCFGPTCRGLTTQTFNNANKCTVPARAGEDTEGWLKSLPGQDSPTAGM